MGIVEVVGLLGTFGLLILVLAIIAFILYLVPIPLGVAAWASGAYVGLMTLIAMRLRRVPPGTVVTARISAVKAGIDISINDLEAHRRAMTLENLLIGAARFILELIERKTSAMDQEANLVDEAHVRRWARGCGTSVHNAQTRRTVRRLLQRLAARGVQRESAGPFDLLCAADRVASTAMWLVAHMSYARRVRLDGEALAQEDFKPDPQGHAGRSLSKVPGCVGCMHANALTGITRSWILDQGHAVAAVDAVNLLLDNMRPEYAARYDVSEPGLSRFVSDFYSFALNQHVNQDSPLGSHVNMNRAGGMLEGRAAHGVPRLHQSPRRPRHRGHVVRQRLVLGACRARLRGEPRHRPGAVVGRA